MNRTLALFIAGTILLLVALTMGEGGPVSQVTGRAPAAGAGESIPSAPRKAATTVQQPSGGNRDWYAPSAPVQTPEIPVYHHNETRVTLPPVVVDPRIAASSPIK